MAGNPFRGIERRGNQPSGNGSCSEKISEWGIGNSLHVRFEISGKIERNEIFEYPVSALRELLLNAVVHRDYTSPTDIQIKIFDNAITFFNPGKLYGGLTVEQLKTDRYQSRTRNKLIAEAFYLTKDIEKYGSGYLRVRKAIADYPSMIFGYEESGDGFLVTLSYSRQKITSGSADEGINALLEQIRKTPGQRVPHYAKELNIPSKTIERWMTDLRDRGSIEYRGSKKTGGYWPL
jgi:ATP-dependent DNA helicase RecG